MDDCEPVTPAEMDDCECDNPSTMGDCDCENPSTIEECEPVTPAKLEECQPVKPLPVLEDTPIKTLTEEPKNYDYDMKGPLPPDHPLLARFQQTLREHLLRIKNQLTEEIDVIKFQIKTKEQEREEIGAKLYDRQNDIQRQNIILEEYSQNIQDTVTRRIEEERLRNDLQKEYDTKFNLTKKRKYEYNQRLVELGHLQSLESNIRNWTEQFELELTSSKRVVSKDAQLQKAMCVEKQKSELMSFNLQVEVKKREEEHQGLAQQLEDQAHMNEVLETSLSDANADLEELQQEHKRLTQAWGEVIVAIQHRDKVLLQARQALEKQLEHYKLTLSSIEGTKKQRYKETEQNDKLEAFKARLKRDLLNLKKDTDKQSNILAKLNMKMEELPKIVEQTEKDLLEAKQEGHMLNNLINAIQFKIEKQNVIKSGIEEQILKIAQDQIMCDKSSKYRLKYLHENQESRRNMEENLHKVEGQLSNLLLELERQKTKILHLHEEGEELSAKSKELSDECDDVDREIKQTETRVAIKIKQIDKLTKILDEALKDSCEGSPTEFKIKTMEKAIQEADQKVQENQLFWLIMQGHFVNLSQKRNNQLNEIQVARKQLMIIKQKSLKMDNEIEIIENNARELEREIQSSGTKLELLNNKGNVKQKQHEINEFECEVEHAELLEKLKNSELSVLQLEQETVDLTKDIEQNKKLVLELHREALSWETKYKLLDETLRWRRNESAIESEIGNMRSEIHRMEIRHKELKRAQEKLIQDLDHCVMHREKIFVVASTKQKLEGKHFCSRTNVQQKLSDVRSKLKQVNIEIIAAEKELQELRWQHAELEKVKCNLQKQIDNEINQDKLITNEIEEGMLLKHQNLENIVRKQNRAKEYRKLTTTGSQHRFSKSEASLEMNRQREVEMNNTLSEVVESLLTDFPHKKFVLKRLAQTLKD